jgi:serine phosphatase RsbU (regulator of sigma subunit)
LEVKNRNITDSIRYAQTIQHTILPSEKELQEAFKDNFVTYLPKDIVSGDFYWLAEISDEGMDTIKTFVAVVDCTGHGVPGAFMSMVGGNLLNEIVKIRREYDPATILQQLDHAVVDALKQQDTVNNDGMDVALCLFDNIGDTHTQVTFVGTRRPLYYLQKGQGLQEVRGDRTSIGGIHRKDYKAKAFTNNTIQLELGTMLYLTTDGIADQHNIHKEKFSTQRLRSILEENAHLDCATQKILLEQTLQQYMKGVEQRDDITIMGIRI